MHRLGRRAREEEETARRLQHGWPRGVQLPRGRGARGDEKVQHFGRQRNTAKPTQIAALRTPLRIRKDAREFTGRFWFARESDYDPRQDLDRYKVNNGRDATGGGTVLLP